MVHEVDKHTCCAFHQAFHVWFLVCQTQLAYDLATAKFCRSTHTGSYGIRFSCFMVMFVHLQFNMIDPQDKNSCCLPIYETSWVSPALVPPNPSYDQLNLGKPSAESPWGHSCHCPRLHMRRRAALSSHNLSVRAPLGGARHWEQRAIHFLNDGVIMGTS